MWLCKPCLFTLAPTDRRNFIVASAFIMSFLLLYKYWMIHRNFRIGLPLIQLTSAPDFRSRFTHMAWYWCAATHSGVCPLLSVRFMSAPASNSNFKQLTWPFWADIANGVFPFAFALFIEAPCFNINCTHFVSPLPAAFIRICHLSSSFHTSSPASSNSFVDCRSAFPPATHNRDCPRYLGWFTWAPACSNNFTHSGWHWVTAACIGVSIHISFGFTSAPASSNTLTHDGLPWQAAVQSGVVPLKSAWFTEAPACVSSSTVVVLPDCIAPRSGVSLPLLESFTQVPASISTLVHVALPLCAAICSGVFLFWSVLFTSAPPSSSNLTHLALSACVAACNGVFPRVSCWFTSAPSSRSCFTKFISPAPTALFSASGFAFIAPDIGVLACGFDVCLLPMSVSTSTKLAIHMRPCSQPLCFSSWLSLASASHQWSWFVGVGVKTRISQARLNHPSLCAKPKVKTHKDLWHWHCPPYISFVSAGWRVRTAGVELGHHWRLCCSVLNRKETQQNILIRTNSQSTAKEKNLWRSKVKQETWSSVRDFKLQT